MREPSLFSGAGGGLLGTKLLGWEHVGYVEFNDYCQRVIRQQIKDGILDEAPIFGDIRTFISEGYADSYQGMVDVVTAGFPCQPFSVAGKGEGEDDPRNMWPQTKDVLCKVRPKYALLENVTGLLNHEYIRRIFGDLAEIGFDARWGSFTARDEGGPIERERLFIACSNKSNGSPGLGNCSKATISRTGGEECPSFWLQAPSVSFGVEHGMDSYVEQVGAIGNGQVPAVVRAAWEILS